MWQAINEGVPPHPFAIVPKDAIGIKSSPREEQYPGLTLPSSTSLDPSSLICTPQRETPCVHSAKKCIYFDPDGIRARALAIPVVSSLQTMKECAMLECIEPFLQGRELIRGCKVGVTRNHRRYFYMVYTKYQRNTSNCSIREESGNRESWNGPLVVMRLDANSATRLVSITSKSHKDIAIQAVAK